MTTFTRYLMIKANGDVRVITRRPPWNRIPYDTICVPIKVNLPEAWGAFLTSIEIAMPDPPEVLVDLGGIEVAS